MEGEDQEGEGDDEAEKLGEGVSQVAEAGFKNGFVGGGHGKEGWFNGEPASGFWV